MSTESFVDPFLDKLPPYLRNASLGIPLIVAFYVIILGLVLTSALKRQKVSIRELRREQSNMFSMLDEDEDEDEIDGGRSRTPVTGIGAEGDRKRATKGKGADPREDWENLSCR